MFLSYLPIHSLHIDARILKNQPKLPRAAVIASRLTLDSYIYLFDVFRLFTIGTLNFNPNENTKFLQSQRLVNYIQTKYKHTLYKLYPSV